MPHPEFPKFDPAPTRERMRGRLAWAVVGLLAGTIFLAFLLVGLKRVSVEDMRTLLEPIVPAEVALAGSAIGFYFGGRAQSAKS